MRVVQLSTLTDRSTAVTTLVANVARTRVMRATLSVALCAGLLAPLTSPSPAHANATFGQTTLELINQQRTAAGVAPVQGSLVLDLVAGPGPYLGCGLPISGRASDMGIRNYFSHTIPGCSSQSVFHILNSTVGLVYSGAAENIAWMSGTTDPTVAARNLMTSLMSSPGHKANILNPKFTHVGIGSWTTNQGQTWSGGGTPLTNVWITAQVFAQMPLAAAPAATVTPTSLSFGERAVGTSGAVQTVTLANGGSASLAISSTTVGGANSGDFTIASTNCGTSVPAGGSCSIGVGFKPGAVGARSASLTVSDSAAGSPRTVILSGNGAAAPVPVAPTNVRATGGDGRLTVTWSTAPSGTTPVGFGVFVYDDGGYTGMSLWVCATCTSAEVTGLTNGKTYYAVVQGYNGSAWGTGGVSNWSSAAPELKPPTNARSTSGNGAMTVSWDLPTTPGTGIDGYGVFVHDSSGYTGKSAWVCAACGTAAVSGLTNGKSYYAVISPHISSGWAPSASTDSVVIGTTGPPGSVVAVKGNGSVTVSWTPPTSSGAAPLSGYGIFVYEGGRYAGQSLWVCATCTTGHVSGLTNGRQYTAQVQAYNAHGWGAPTSSNPVTPTF